MFFLRIRVRYTPKRCPVRLMLLAQCHFHLNISPTVGGNAPVADRNVALEEPWWLLWSGKGGNLWAGDSEQSPCVSGCTHERSHQPSSAGHNNHNGTFCMCIVSHHHPAAPPHHKDTTWGWGWWVGCRALKVDQLNQVDSQAQASVVLPVRTPHATRWCRPASAHPASTPT